MSNSPRVGHGSCSLACRCRRSLASSVPLVRPGQSRRCDSNHSHRQEGDPMPAFPDNPKPNQRFITNDQVLYRWDARMALWRILHTDARSPALFSSIGTIVDFAGGDVPVGWYLCDGSEKNRDDDAE